MGVRVSAKEDDIIGMSQNIPVHPGKQSHAKKSSSRTRHSPLVQLTRSHTEMLGEGDGETKTELAGATVSVNTVVRGGLEVLSSSRLEKAVVAKIEEEEVKSISQKSPLHPSKH